VPRRGNILILSGHWVRVRCRSAASPAFDPTQALGARQQAPLDAGIIITVLEASVADQAGRPARAIGIPAMMPAARLPSMMTLSSTWRSWCHAGNPYVRIDHAAYFPTAHRYRRPATAREGRASFMGYSLGQVARQDGAAASTPCHRSIHPVSSAFRARSTGRPCRPHDTTRSSRAIFLDKQDPNLLHDQITLIETPIRYSLPGRCSRLNRRDHKGKKKTSPYPFGQEYYCSGDH